jgi:hypothetical protein
MRKNQRIQLALLAIITLWLVGSITMSLLGLFNQPHKPPIYLGLFMGVPVVGFLLAYAMSKSLREVLLAVPLWVVVLIHAGRLEAIFFVIDAITGVLPPRFGWSAGMGDIVAAIISIPLALSLRQGHRSKGLSVVFIAWNILGLLDLFNAAILGVLYSPSVVGILSHPGLDSHAITYMPIVLIPTFYVPILILLHFLALRRRRETAS